jgi:GNAT superfamily N-acetyltransferase
MRRPLSDGFELDDDPERLDVDAIHRFLSTEAYWALGRTRVLVEQTIAGSARVVGLYREGRQLGFARVVSDGVWFAYLADVYIAREARGRGLGVELVREAVDNGPHASCAWVLHTDDAQSLYAKLGFGPPGPRVMERRRPGA